MPMPRRSGTMTVRSLTNASARGTHISPVSPKPCSRSTAGPRPPTRTYWVPPLAGICRARKVSGQTPIVAWAVGVQAVSAAAKAVSAVARNGCREVNRLNLASGGSLLGFQGSPGCCLRIPLIMRAFSEMPGQAEKGLGRHGVQHIDKILGTTRQVCISMLDEAKPDNEPGRHSLPHRRDRKRSDREFVRADLKGCSNAGFFILPPQYRR